MLTTITCACGKQIDVQQSLAEQITRQLTGDFDAKRQELLSKYQQSQQKLNDEKQALQQQQADFNQIVLEKSDARVESLLDERKKQLEAQHADKLQLLLEENNQKTQAIRELERKEMLLLNRQQELEHTEERLKLEAARQLQQDRQRIAQEIHQAEQEAQLLKLGEKDLQIDRLKKDIETLQRKSLQGSTELQGESLEIALEQILIENFGLDDTIESVERGRNGADFVQIVRNEQGKAVGRMVYETKNTQDFSKEWLQKFKADMLRHKGDIAILITRTMPKNMKGAGLLEGVWVCSLHEARCLIPALRAGLLRAGEIATNEAHKGEKMQLLYQYLTSPQFCQQIKMLLDVFCLLNEELESEKRAFKTRWARRAKLIEQVSETTLEVFGSIKGIAGAAISDIDLLELESASDNLLPEAAE